MGADSVRRRNCSSVLRQPYRTLWLLPDGRRVKNLCPGWVRSLQIFMALQPQPKRRISSGDGSCDPMILCAVGVPLCSQGCSQSTVSLCGVLQRTQWYTCGGSWSTNIVGVVLFSYQPFRLFFVDVGGFAVVCKNGRIGEGPSMHPCGAAAFSVPDVARHVECHGDSILCWPVCPVSKLVHFVSVLEWCWC